MKPLPNCSTNGLAIRVVCLVYFHDFQRVVPLNSSTSSSTLPSRPFSLHLLYSSRSTTSYHLQSTSFWHTSFASRGFSGCMPLSAPVSLPSLDLLIHHWHHPDALILTPNSSSTLPVSSSSSTPLTLPLPISRVYSNEMIYSASFNYLSPIWILQIPSILAAKSRRFVFQPPSFRTWPTILLLSCIMFRLSLITII